MPMIKIPLPIDFYPFQPMAIQTGFSKYHQPSFMYKGTRAHAHIYIIKITVGRLYSVLLHGKLHNSPFDKAEQLSAKGQNIQLGDCGVH